MVSTDRLRFQKGACVLLLLSFSTLQAQYIERLETEPREARYISAGVMMRDFAPLPSNALPDSLRIRYKALMPMIGFRQGPVEFLFGYTSYDHLGGSRTSIFFGTTISSELPLTGRGPGGLTLPVLLAADYTKSETGGPQKRDFNIGSVGVGMGLKYRHMSRTIDFQLHGEAIAHLSFEGYSGRTGFSAAAIGEAAFMLKNVLVLDGIVLGYRFRYQRWAMGDDEFNYRAITHGPFLGVML